MSYEGNIKRRMYSLANDPDAPTKDKKFSDFHTTVNRNNGDMSYQVTKDFDDSIKEVFAKKNIFQKIFKPNKNLDHLDVKINDASRLVKGVAFVSTIVNDDNLDRPATELALFYRTTLLIDKKYKTEYIDILKKLGFEVRKLITEKDKIYCDTVLPRGWFHCALDDGRMEFITDNNGSVRMIVNNQKMTSEIVLCLTYNIKVEEKPEQCEDNWTPAWLRLETFQRLKYLDIIDTQIPLNVRAKYLTDKISFNEEIFKGAQEIFNAVYPENKNPLEYW